MNQNRCTVVVGAQWGDEGKGKIVDVLAAETDIVARYQGGANAGHTVYVAGDQFILRQIPSGILHAGTRCLLGNGVVLDPPQFFEELDGLAARGVEVEGRIGISGRAHLLLPYHKRLDQAREAELGSGKIGTTGRGIGPAYEDKIARRGVRAADLRDATRAAGLVRDATARVNRDLVELGAERLDPDTVAEEVLALRPRLLPLLTDTGLEITAALKAERRVLLEGAQGALLDVDHGTYPFVTSSNTTAGGASVGVGIGPTAIDAVLGVVKAYTTRVGSGPLPTEIPGEIGEELRRLGGEFGAVTGRPRRCGWFDAVVVRYGARVNGLSGLAITKLDVLDSFDEIRVAVAYEIDGQVQEEFPDSLAVLERARPIYETLPGWRVSTSAARTPEDLPAAARAYLRRLEELTGVPTWYISVGTGREQIIRVG
ncbi:MAG TPA: adenylosuccinate synthase [Longimicrobiales bacterium]|nr:adenylosuccinate synthase [Longimicrobiales bacterium]